MEKIVRYRRGLPYCGVVYDQRGNEPQPSLEVSPTSLIFAAAAAPAQEVTVTAVGTDWEYELVGNASEWVTVTEDRTKGLLTVGVQDNPQAEQRTASLTVNAAGGSGIKVKTRP